jgi:hypothetical protein
MFGAAIASSMFFVADDAKEKFIEVMAPFSKQNPDGEVRVFVIDFSRGAVPATIYERCR